MKKITFILFAMLAFSLQSYAQNETCATATPVTPGSFTGTAIVASSGGGVGGGAGTRAAAWFSYTATGDGTIDVSACDGGADTRLYVHDDCAGPSIANNDDECEFAPDSDAYASEVTGVPVVNGTTYYIEWDDRWTGGDSFDWSLSFIPAPLCTFPTATAALGTLDCVAGTFMIDVDVTDVGDASSFTISNDAGVASSNETAVGMYSVGPFVSGSNVTITIEHDQDNICNLELAPISSTCPPINDACAGAITILDGDSLSGDTSAATNVEALTPCANGTVGIACDTGVNDGTVIFGAGVWYVYNSPGQETVSVQAGGFDTELQVFSGACGALVCVAGDDDSGAGSNNSQVCFDAVTAGTYYIYLDGNTPTTTGPFNIDLNTTAFPVCVQPVNLQASALSGDTTAALSWNAEASAVSGFNWAVMVDGEDVADMANTPVSNGVTAAGVTMATATDLTPASNYDLYVQSNCDTDGVSVWSGPFSFTATMPPANDFCSGALPLTLSTIDTCDNAVSGSTSAASASSTGCTGGRDVWYSFVAPSTGNFVVSVTETFESASFISTYISAYEGVCGTLSQIGSNISCFNTAPLNIATVSGNTYYVSVRSSNATGYTDFDLCIAPPPLPPANDTCATAITAAVGVGAFGPNITTNNTGATDSGVPSAACTAGNYNGGDIWYEFTTPSFATEVNYTMTVNTGFSSALINVYDNCTDLNVIFCSTLFGNGSMTMTGLTGSTSYLLRLSDFGNNSVGAVEFNLSAAIPNDDCPDAIALTLGADTAFDNTGGSDSGFSPACYTGDVRDIWYSFDAPTSGEVTITVGGSAAQYALYSSCSPADVISCNQSANTDLTDGATYFISVTDDGTNKVPGASTLRVDDTSTLSTTDFSNGLAFSYYPNPVNNTLTLNAQQAITNVAVYNMLGQEVIRTAPNAVSNDVDMSNLQSGAYFVQVTVGTTVETVRIIRN